MDQKQLKKKGDKKFSKATDLITTGLFNWSKDYVSAASQFDEALQLYKKAQAYPECIKTLQQLIKCNDKNRDAWAVARNHEAMMEIYIDKKVPISDEQFINMTQTTFSMFRLATSTEKGLKIMKNCAKYLMNKGKMEEAIRLLRSCYEQSLEDQKCYSQGQIFNGIVEALVDQEKYAEAVKLTHEKVKKDQQNGKQHLDQECLVVVLLAILDRDLKTAEDLNYELMSIVQTYAVSHQSQTAFNLIKFCREGDAQKFKKQTTRACITTLFPINIIRKLREMKLVTGTVVAGSETEEQKKMLKELFY